MRITVLGGGSWGTALAHLLADKGAEAGQTRNLQVTLLVRDAQTAEAINEQRENPRYLPGLLLSPHLRAETSPGAALDGAAVALPEAGLVSKAGGAVSAARQSSSSAPMISVGTQRSRTSPPNRISSRGPRLAPLGMGWPFTRVVLFWVTL